MGNEGGEGGIGDWTEKWKNILEGNFIKAASLMGAC